MKILIYFVLFACPALAQTETGAESIGKPTFDQRLSEMFHSLAVVGDSDTPEHLTKEILDFCGANPAVPLLAHLKYVHDRGELRQVSELLRAIKPDAVNTIIEELKGENNPAQKGKLIRCLGAFSGRDVLAALKLQLDDSRMSDEPHGFEWPRVVGIVRVEAYNVITSILEESLSHEERRKLRFQRANASDSDRESRFDALKARLTALGL